MGDRPITLFRAGNAGYGFSEGPPIGYHHAYNWDCRGPLGAYPSMAPMLQVSPSNSLEAGGPVAFAVDWTDAAGLPRIIFALGGDDMTGAAWYYQDAEATGVNLGTSAVATGGALYRYDQDATADPDEEMIFFCNGATKDTLWRMKKDNTIDDGTGHTMKADGLWVIGSDLWASQGYKVAKCTTNADPGLATSFPTLIPVGIPTYPVNEIVNLGGSPVVLTGAGVFIYNAAPSTPDFQNITPSVTPHPDNGKGGFTDGRGRVYYPTIHGDVLVISFGAQDQQRPTKMTTINRDTPWGPITAMTADTEYVYAAVAPGARRSANGMGLVVKVNDGGVYATPTTNATDDKISTVVDVSALTGVADSIYIGADVPFHGIYCVSNAARTGAYGGFLIEYSAGASAWVEATNSFDSTLGFYRSGAIVMKTSAGSNLLTAATPWATDTVDGVTTKYWMRLTLLAGTTLTAAKIGEIQLLPYRPPLDDAVFPISAYELSGALPKILVGQWQGEDIIWYDVWTLNAPRIDKMLVSRTPVGLTDYYERRLYVFAGGELKSTGAASTSMNVIPVGMDAHPAVRPWPKLADYSEAGTADPTHIIYLTGSDFGLPDEVKECLGGVLCDMPFVQADDIAHIYYWWDDDAEKYEYAGGFSKPTFTTGPLAGSGRVLYVAIQFVDGSRSQVAPYLRLVQVPAENWESIGPLDSERSDLAAPLGR